MWLKKIYLECDLFKSSRHKRHVQVRKLFSDVFNNFRKGIDLTSVILDVNEITQFKMGHYISTSEAVHCIFQFDTHDQIPNVIRLQVHLPGQHMVVFNPDDNSSTIQRRAASEKTTLTAWFKANSNIGQLGQIARQHSYQEFPQHFVWKDNTKSWDFRKQGFAIGHLYFVPPTAGECFYL